jgi:hypothetical protein
MKSFFNSFMVLCLLGITSMVYGQTVFWSENFTNGIPASWTNTGTGASTVGGASATLVKPWQHTAQRRAPRWTAQPAFASATRAAFVFFNGDSIKSQDVALTTSAISCTGRPVVFARFLSQYAFFTTSSTPELGVSTNNSTWTYYPVLTTVVRNALTDSVQISEVNISAQAANQANVYLRLRWRGSDEYDWKVDDIQLQDAPTVLAPDLSPDPKYAVISPVSQTPKEQGLSTYYFAVKFKNEGTQTASNVKVFARLKNSGGTVLHADTVSFASIQAGAVDTAKFTKGYTPTSPLVAGTYTVEYQTKLAAADRIPTNDLFSSAFVVTDSMYAHDSYSRNPLSTQFAFTIGRDIPSGTSNFSILKIFAHYYIKTASTTSGAPLRLTNIGFVPFAATTVNIAGKTFNFSVYKWDDANEDGGVDDSEFSNANKVGFASWTVPTGWTYNAANPVVKVPVLDPITFSLYPRLQDNTDYFVVLEGDFIHDAAKPLRVRCTDAPNQFPALRTYADKSNQLFHGVGIQDTDAGGSNPTYFMRGYDVPIVLRMYTNANVPSVSNVSCSTGAISPLTINPGVPYSGTATINYTGGNGLAYAAGAVVNSTGVTGLTLARTAGTLANGNGTFGYTLTGTPNGTGTARFSIAFDDKFCTFNVAVLSNESVINQSDIKVTPNPATDLMVAKFKFTKIVENATLEVSDLMGNVITTENRSNLSEGEFNYNVKNLAAGQYNFTVRVGSQVSTSKFIVK